MNPYISNTQVSAVLKPVCFSNWDEWISVKEGFFSQCCTRQQHALKIVAMWRQRGDIPHSIESTANFIEIQLQDPFFNHTQSSSSANSLRMLYSMAIIRAVNGLVDPGQQSYFAQSVLVLAERLGLPGWIVELRHDGTHKQLPSISVLREATQYMLGWYNRNYWTPQLNNLQSLMDFCLTPMIDPAITRDVACSDGRREQWFNALLKHSISPGFVSDIFLPIFIDAITVDSNQQLPSTSTITLDSDDHVHQLFSSNKLLWQPVFDALSKTHSHLWIYSATSRLIHSFSKLIEIHKLDDSDESLAAYLRKARQISNWVVHLLLMLQQQIRINAVSMFKSNLELSRFNFIATAITMAELLLSNTDRKTRLLHHNTFTNSWGSILESVFVFNQFLQEFLPTGNQYSTIDGDTICKKRKHEGKKAHEKLLDETRISMENEANANQKISKFNEASTISFKQLMTSEVPISKVMLCTDFPVWPIGYWPGQYDCHDLASIEVVPETHSSHDETTR